MTDSDRNIRTLISCFVIAIVALVPLRMVELLNYNSENAMVLGEETYNQESVYEKDLSEKEYVVEEEIDDLGNVLDEEIILPETE